MIGKILGNRYEIVEEIGKGGTAIVYRATCHILNRSVAVKVLRPEFRDDTDFIRRFKAEAQSAAKLSHPNIVSIYDVGSQDDVDYIVMEYVEGVTLKQYIQAKGIIPWKEAVDYAAQICSGLEHAHKKGIVHKDIKPQNVIMTREGILKITDFGIARVITSGTVTVGDQTMGSVHYLSPEQARGGYVDERSDIYSLGVVLYEMVTGRLPFNGDTPIGIAMQHLEKPAVPPSKINPDVPPSLDEVILKAMSKEQSRRYDSATKMIIDLKKVYIGTAVHYSDDDYMNGDTTYIPPVKRTPVSGLTSYGSEDGDDYDDEDEDDYAPERRQKVKTKTKTKKKMNKKDKRSMIIGVVAGVIIVAAAIGLFYYFFGVNPGDDVELPDFAGKTIEEAQEMVKNTKIKIVKDSEENSTEYEKDQIIRQTPTPNKKVKNRSTVKVVVSLGSEESKVPDCLNMKVDDAQKRLTQAGLSVDIQLESNDSIPENYVIRQSPTSGSSLAKNGTVTLYVSKGRKTQTARVPNLIGLTESAAKEQLLEKGLTYGSVKTEYSSKPAGTVTKQSIKNGTEVAQKTSIDFVVSLGEEATPEPATPKPSTPTPVPSVAPTQKPTAAPTQKPADVQPQSNRTAGNVQ